MSSLFHTFVLGCSLSLFGGLYANAIAPERLHGTVQLLTAWEPQGLHADNSLLHKFPGTAPAAIVPDALVEMCEAGRYVAPQEGGADREYFYRLFIPVSKVSAEGLPLIVWLHGHGQYELSVHNRGQLAYVAGLVIRDLEHPVKYPFYLLAVQCPKELYWNLGKAATNKLLGDRPIDAVIGIIDEVLDRQSIDRNRVYLVGISSGGTAAWEILNRRPDLFAAAAPLACAPPTNLNVGSIDSVPIWTFRSTADDSPKMEVAASAIRQLQNKGVRCHLTKVVSDMHDVWTTAFLDYDILQWLLIQRRGCVECPPPGSISWETHWRLLRKSHFNVDSWGPLLGVMAVTSTLLYAIRREILRRRKSISIVDAQSDAKACGFTLIEVLVVIAIIGVLVAMLLPAIEMARESSRRSVCANNLRQQAVAVRLHIGTHQTFPTGGWGPNWLGDPDAGYSSKQPGGWVYNILTYIEEDSLRQLGRGLRDAPRDEAMTQLMKTPLEVLYCPSRRLTRIYPYTGGELKNAKPSEKVAKTDYAISKTISYEKSEVILSDIQLHGKGTSKTVLAGEKSLSSESYTTGSEAGDTLVAYVGDSDDIRREPTGLPTADKVGGSGFGGPHPGGANMAYCDGSVRFVKDDEQLETMQ